MADRDEREAKRSGGVAMPAHTARYALTVRQPWAHAIAYLGKRIENRTWKPPPVMVGTGVPVLIHAGSNWMDPEVGFFEKHPDLRSNLPKRSSLPGGVFVAVAKIASVVTESNDPWFLGPNGWVLEDVIPLNPPLVSAKGALGLWIPRPETLDLLDELNPTILFV